MPTFHVGHGRVARLSRARLLGALVIFAALAAGCATPAEPEGESSVQQALCSATQQCPGGQTISCSSSGTDCNSGQDKNGVYVDCGTGRQYCPASSCTCGTQRYSVFVYDAHGSTCSEARSNARAQALAQAQCAYDECNESIATACELDPAYGGYRGEAEYYYSCTSC